MKADNILLDPAGVCKISDFGISKKVDDLQNIRAFTNMKGTIQWMAPEILVTKKAGYDAKVDIWSVGCVVLEMWSGERPWSNEILVSVMYKVNIPYYSRLTVLTHSSGLAIQTATAHSPGLKVK